MVYLLLSILTATSLVVIIRLFERWNIKTSYGIVFNYIFCVITGLFFVDDFAVFTKIPSWQGFPWVIGLGCTFLLTFLLIGKTTITSGITTTSIAMKLSFVIPVIAAVLLYGDAVTFLKIIGVICAIVSVGLISYEKAGINRSHLFYPFLIFIVCGLCDATFNHVQRTLLPAGWDHQVTIAIFASAATSGILLNFYKKDLYQWKNVAAGLLLGVPNYFSLFFLLKTLRTIPLQSSVIFPINNLGIVCLTAFAGYVFFKEKFSVRKLAGFILAIASIVIIGFL